MPNSQIELVGHLKTKGILRTERIIQAFLSIDRVNFILAKYQDQTYGDYPLPIGYNQTISQPTTVAFMLELLQPQSGEKILDVGTGSGWTTALLAHIAGENGFVFGVELIPELVEFGSNNLKKCNFSNVQIVPASKDLGLSQEAPFDKILVSAAAHFLPEELLSQLSVGGRMVIPIGSSILQIDKISENDFDKKEFTGFSFVPLRI